VIDVGTGFFVDVPDLGLSGLVHLSSIEDDFSVFDSQPVDGASGGELIKWAAA
jgi:exoribonuclease R